MKDNSGTSITNMAEGIATLVCREHDIPHEQLIWIEHYPRAAFRVPDRYPTWDLVTFKSNGERFANPQWSHLEADEAQAIIEGQRPTDYQHRTTTEPIRAFWE